MKQIQERQQHGSMTSSHEKKGIGNEGKHHWDITVRCEQTDSINKVTSIHTDTAVERRSDQTL